MPFVLNLYAIIQLIIALLVLGVVHLIAAPFGYQMIGGTKETFVALLILALVCAYTDARGTLKGKLFYLPTWFVLILVAIFDFSINYQHTKPEKAVWYQLFLVLAIIFIFYIYNITTRKHLKKTWLQKQEILSLLKAETATNGNKTPLFWKLANAAYFKPSNFFLFFNYIWRVVYGRAINENEFLQYYKEFIVLIPIENIPTIKYKSWITDLQTALNETEDFESYHHPTFGLHRLGTVLEGMGSD